MGFVVLALGASLACSACSSSRTVNADEIIEPGRHVSRSVIGSDILVKKGSTFEVSFSSGSRFFIEKGGALVGFQSGVRDTRIYAEKGAHFPNRKYLSQTPIEIVPSASKSFRDRSKALPPLTSRVTESEAIFYDDYYYYHDRRSRSGATSVRPSSYKTKD